MLQLTRLLILSATLLLVILTLGACGESEPEEIAPSPEAIQSTEAIEDSLMSSMNEIASDQQLAAEEDNVEELEKLSEADRQALIELTADEADERIDEDAEKLRKILESSN